MPLPEIETAVPDSVRVTTTTRGLFVLHDPTITADSLSGGGPAQGPLAGQQIAVSLSDIEKLELVGETPSVGGMVALIAGVGIVALTALTCASNT